MAFDLAPFAERRRRFAEAIGDALAVIPAARETPRNADTGFEFRQDSDFYFLTGFDEPDAVAVINPAHAKERFVLFVRPRDREMEVWNGRRAGVEGAVATYGADAAYTVDELDAKLREYAIDRTGTVYRLGNPHHDPRMIRLVAEMRGVRARGFATPARVEDPGPILHELRLRRSPEELARQRRACEISRDAHIEAMRYARPGQYEYEVQAALEFVFRKHGSPRNAYPSIVASGPNATILHYSENNRRMEDGDLLLIDAGCEWGYHAADITRTFPVNGRFTAAPAAHLRRGAARAARRHRGRAPGQPLRGDARGGAARARRGPRRARPPARRSRGVARHAPLPRVLHARHRPLARHGRPRRRRLPRSPAVAGARARHGGHRRARPLLRPRARAASPSTCASTARRRCGSAATASAWPRRRRSRTRKRRAPRRWSTPCPPSTAASASASRTTS